MDDDPTRGERGRTGRLLLGTVGALVFVLTAGAVLAVDKLADSLRDENKASVSEVRREAQEVKREQLRAADVRAISRRLIEAEQPTAAQFRRDLDRALRRLTVRQRQRLINSLLRVATRRQKRLLFGLPRTRRIAPSAPSPSVRSIPRLIPRSRPPTVTPPAVGVTPVLPPVTQRPPRDEDREDEDDRDRERGGDRGDDRRNGD